MSGRFRVNLRADWSVKTHRHPDRPWSQPFVEFVGTFWLIFCGCGNAVISAGIPQPDLRFTAIAPAFSLTVLDISPPRRTPFLPHEVGEVGEEGLCPGKPKWRQMK